jgi:predicted nucleic acid-binding protein
VTAVSDSSPLITLARIEYLHLLPKLYPRVSISTEVYREVAVAGVGLPGATQVSEAGWIDVVPVKNSRGLELVTAGTALGAGEVSTVLLAKELSAEVVLM